MATDNDADRRAKDDVTETGAEKAGVTGRGTLDRRTYLKLTGSAAAAALGTAAAAGSAAAQTTVDDISFDRTVDIVEDLGADNTGSQSIDGELNEAISGGTLITFPEGEYKIANSHRLPSGANVGFVGEGDVVFAPPQGSNFSMFASGVSSPANQVLFKNIDFDIRPDNTVTGLRFNTQNGVYVEDVEYVGRGTHSDGSVANALTVTISNADATGVVRNVVATQGSSWARYKSGDGRIGIGVFQPHSGTLKVVDCHLEEFGNNGMYASRHTGKVQIEGGTFRNNNVASVRISGQGNYVEGATIEIDPEKYEGPRESNHESNAFGMRAVWINGRKFDKQPGAEVRDCDIVVRDHPAPNSAIRVSDNSTSLAVRNTRIQHDLDDMAAVRSEPNGHPVELESVSITGDASGGAAVNASNSPDSVVRNCCIEQSGSNRSGVVLSGSNGSAVRDCNINVTGQAVDVSSSGVETANITNGDSCPAPSLDGGSGNPNEGSWGSDLDNTVTVESTGEERANYEFAVSEELEAGLDANLSGAEIPDAVDGTTGTGSVAQYGSDNYRFNGEITVFAVDGPANVLVNGEAIDLSQFGDGSDGGSDDGSGGDGSDGSGDDSSGDGSDGDSGSDESSGDATPSRTLRIASTGEDRASYEFSVSEALEAGDRANLSGADHPDAVQGTDGSGSVALYGSDTYAFAGEVTAFAVDGPADVFVDDEQIDPADYDAGDGDSGSDDGSDSADPSRTVTVESTGEDRATYEFTVTDVVEPGDSANLSGAEFPDAVQGTTASGSVAVYGSDDYLFAGEITAFSVDGPADVYVDGEQVDPSQFDDSDGSGSAEYPNLLVIDGDGAESSSDYSFTVSGELEKAPDVGMVESDDVVSDGSATGQVAGGTDAYRFSGNITSFLLSGSASVDFENGE